MSDRQQLEAIAASEVPPGVKPSNYPEPYASQMNKREKSRIGEFFGLKNFGVNLTRLAPGGRSALMHAHSKQDELVYVLKGKPTLVTESGERPLVPGMCAGFPAGGEAHHLVNHTDKEVVFLEIGDRATADEVNYPNDDLQAVMGQDGRWQFMHKDGTPY